MSKNCDMIRDLLPLYTENMCSEESKKFVAEHLAGCESCKNELKKMNSTIAIQADHDISALKRIKKRAATEKIVIAVISVIVVVVTVYLRQYFLINADCTMDYEKYSLSENVWVEEDEKGDLWFCTQGAAMSACAKLPTLSDTDGNHMSYNSDDKGFDSTKKAGIGYTLKQRRINSYADVDIYAGLGSERSFLFNKNEKTDLTYVFYYDDVNDTEYVLWERK